MIDTNDVVAARPPSAVTRVPEPSAVPHLRNDTPTPLSMRQRIHNPPALSMDPRYPPVITPT